MVKKDKSGVPRPKEVYDWAMSPEKRMRLGHTSLGLGSQQVPREVGKLSTQPPLPPPPSHEEDPISPSTTLEDQVHDLTTQFNVYWDETQEHQVSISRIWTHSRST